MGLCCLLNYCTNPKLSGGWRPEARGWRPASTERRGSAAASLGRRKEVLQGLEPPLWKGRVGKLWRRLPFDCTASWSPHRRPIPRATSAFRVPLSKSRFRALSFLAPTSVPLFPTAVLRLPRPPSPERTMYC